MKSFAVVLAGAAAVLAASPTASAPAGCATTYDSSFEISVTKIAGSSKRDLTKRTALVATLTDGVLTDAENRTGEIVANYQFQFDALVQDNAIYTSGWSVCSNGTLAIGNSAVFYECLSGTFYNLYSESTGDQCTPIYINVVDTDSSSSTSSGATQISDGQLQATSAVVSQITDGQVQATSAVVSQITDGQLQAATGVVVSQITDGQLQLATSTAAVVSQISDGQIQATTAVVSQISDGQIQATSAAVVSQISDGQIQATTAVVSQISDGQIQATSAGTIMATSLRNATTPTVAAVSATVSSYTGAAAQATAGFFGIAAGAIALALL